MNMMTAHNQWATRPADERFWTLDEMLRSADDQRRHCAAMVKNVKSLRVRAHDDSRGLSLCSDKGESAFTHFSFGQLVRFAAPEGRVSASPEYLRRLPANLAADCVNYDLERCDRDTLALVQLSEDGKRVQSRAFTTEKYGRIWNSEIIRNLMPLQNNGWRVPPARPASDNDPRARIATSADVLLSSNRNSGGLAVKEGDMIAPAGLYMGEKDMFAFMVNESRGINGGGGTTLYRGFFCENSEVGSLSYWITSFLYNTVCGNHIVWGASNVQKIRVVHIGKNAGGRAHDALRVELTKYADSSATEMEAKIESARIFEFGATKDEVVDSLFGKKVLPRKTLEAAFDMAERFPQDGGNASPRSAWGMAQGVTRLSQESAFMDERVELDKASGKILELVG